MFCKAVFDISREELVSFMRLGNVVRSVLLMLVAALVSAANLPAMAGEKVTHQDPAFTLDLPDGFEELADPKQAGPNAIYFFVREDEGEQNGNCILMIEKMPGTISRRRLAMENFPRGFQGNLFTTQWDGFEINANAIVEEANGERVITYNVQIPLKKNALIVRVAGHSSKEKMLLELLKETLAGLKGETTWSIADKGKPLLEPSTSAVSSDGMIMSGSFIDANRNVIFGGIALFVLVGLVGLYFLSRMSQKGTVFAIAVVVYIVGFSVGMQKDQSRESLLFAGTAKMFGIVAGVLGVVDLVRKRK